VSIRVVKYQANKTLNSLFYLAQSTLVEDDCETSW
jgi:hypothetical protein